jgi:outer membrane receptor protein involved in Fe transport
MRGLLFFCGLICSISPVFSQTDSSASLKEVVVTATKNQHAVQELPFSVYVLDQKKAIQNLNRTLPESLTGIPGLFIQKTNHGGGSPFVRGLTGNQNLILMDGIRVNNAIFRYGPNQYMNLIDPLIMQRVEVVKGSGAVQYGSDAMTGVIHVLSKTPEYSDSLLTGGSMHLRFTEDDMEQVYRPDFYLSSKRVAFTVGASIKKFGDLKGGEATGIQIPSGYNEGGWNTKLRIQLNKKWELTTAYFALKQQDVPVYHKYVLENFKTNTSDPIWRNLGYIKAEKKYNSGLLRGIRLFAANQQIGETRFSEKNGSTVRRKEMDKVNGISAGADFYTLFSRIWNVNSGVELYQDRVFSERYDTDLLSSSSSPQQKRGLYPDGSFFRHAALYTLHHFELKKWNFEAGARYHVYRIGIKEATLGDVLIQPSALVFQSAVSYRLGSYFNVYANLGSGYRAPNIDDMGSLGLVDFRYEVPSYELRPEKSINRELGIKWNSKRARGSFSYFHTSLQDIISRIKTAEVINGYSVYKKENSEKGFIRGWEFETGIEPVKGLSVTGMATQLYGQNTTQNEPLRRIPPFNARIVLMWTNRIFNVGFIHDYASPQRRLAQGDKDDNRIPKGGTPGFNVLSSFASVDHKKIMLRLYFSNLFNVDYRTHGSGINGMGRAASIQVTYSFGKIK